MSGGYSMFIDFHTGPGWMLGLLYLTIAACSWERAASTRYREYIQGPSLLSPNYRRWAV